MLKRDDPKTKDVPKKVQDGKKDVNMKDVEKLQPSFNLENEISNINISTPFNELLKNAEYRGKIIKMLKLEEEISDTLNLKMIILHFFWPNS
jgi:hypothetical protein